MRMDMKRNTDALFNALYKLIGIVRQQQVGHILNADGLCTHLLQLARKV